MHTVSFNGISYEVHTVHTLPVGATYIGHDIWLGVDGKAYRLKY